MKQGNQTPLVPLRQYRFTLATTGATVTQMCAISSIQELFGTVDEIFFKKQLPEQPKYVLQTQEFRLVREDRIKFHQLLPERDYQHFLVVPLFQMAEESSNGEQRQADEVFRPPVVDLE